ncbi:MucB/RseB C-terminal domain-containing protein [Diaphorobacter aerolatus]|uniref:MucB/RseB C-terminal domain-containing protein n=1 Tax=Diaphorobacter aerolatus TaxID=1288495 RepID=A0A7H0GI63_9BURK|nr:MucB/RseB C-terminal domain-containing protein [Diaphorobacter aerolatus]QNP47979.1 MucB/RseB C-terminal domain-containing protein [Diaphorobacter aerolatus]
MSRAQLEQLDVAGWLERMRQATELHTYSGKFMVTSSSRIMSHSRIWHVCSGQRQIERLEALNGTPRIVYRQNAEVRTFLPHEGVVRIESREMPRRFVRVKGIGNESLVAHYVAQLSKSERVAGREADLLQVRPRDASRFGYRIWLDRSSGLVLKWQTVAPSGRVLEEAAFSEIDMGAPLSGSQIEAMMNDVMGYRVIRQARTPTTLERNGWSLPIPVKGFVLLGCAEKQKQQSKDAAQASLESQSTPEARPLKPAGVQCVYSDGLASISVFLEPFSAERHTYGAQALRLGATHTLSGRVAGDGWVTMVGEVPLTTLRDFASAIKQMP